MKAEQILMIALCGLAFGTLTACNEGKGDAAAQQQAMPPLRVSVVKVVRQDVELKSTWFGTLRGVEQAEIRPQVTGRLIRQVYRDGSMCEKGEVLFEIDPVTYEAAVEQAEGNLAAAKATKMQALAARERSEQDVKRYAALIKTGAVSEKTYTDAQQTLKEAQATYEQAEASIKQAEAALKNAQIDLDRTKIRAPFKGLASKSTASIGDLITANGGVLTEMSSIDPIRVDFSVPSKQILGRLIDGNVDVKTGQMGGLGKFELILEDGTVFEERGTIQSVDSEVSRSTGSVNFIGYIPNPGLKLRSGMAVRVRGTTDNVSNAILVPVRSVLSSMNHRTILVVDKNNTPRRIDVQLGDTIVMDMPDGKGGMAPLDMQIVTGTVKPIEESLKEIGYDNPAEAPVIVEGGTMAAQYSKMNELMKAKGATTGFATVIPSPFVYSKPVSTTPSITAKQS